MYTDAKKEELFTAIGIATYAHEGQWYGDLPYIHHPLGVMEKVKSDIDAMIVAVLHDVIEDSEYDAEALIGLGICDRNVRAVEALTRDDSVSYEMYIDGIAALKGDLGKLVREVKLADLNFNLSGIVMGSGHKEHLDGRYSAAISTLMKVDANGV